MRDTEDKPTEAAPQPGEPLGRQVFEKNLAVQLLIDPETGRILEANPAACRFYGYTREQLAAMRITDINVLTPAEVAEAMRAAVSERRNQFRFRHRLASGEMRDVEVHSGPVEIDGRRLLYSIIHDVTDRRQAEEALAESESRFRILFADHPLPMWVYALDDLRILEVNHAAVVKYGYAREEFLQLDIRALRPAEDIPRLMEAVNRTRSGQVRDERLTWRHKLQDGTVIDVDIHAHRLDFAGRAAALVIAQDITEKHRREHLQAALYRIAQTTTAAEDMQSFYRSIHGIVGELMYARNLYVAIAEKGEPLAFEYFVDEEDPTPPLLRPGGKSLTEYVLRTGAPLLASPQVTQELERDGEIELVGAPSVDWLGAPLKRGERTFGVLVVQSYTEDVRFTDADRDLLSFVAQHLATAIDRKRAVDALRESEARFRTLAETAPCAIFIYQGASFRYANPAMTAITGYTRDDLGAMSFWDMVHPDFRDLVRERGLARQRGEEVPGQYEFKMVRKDGADRWVEFTAGAIEIDGRPAALGTAFDVTERKQAEEQIRNLAYHDVLTGLPNRLLFNDRLGIALAQAHRSAQHLAVLFLDVDRFKVINDSLGHTRGDRLLQLMAVRLQDGLREGDSVARLGGDEFTLLLPGLSSAVDAAKVADKILEALRVPFQIDDHELFITASVGIALYPEDGTDGEALVKNADAAMYRAKEQGRDNYQLYTQALTESAVERLSLESSLRRALSNHELIVHYQPILDLATGRVHGVEALVRWQHPERGLVSPSDFIPLAEATGLILPLGQSVLRTACAQAEEWHRRGHPQLTTSVNLSARQFSQPDVVEMVKRVLEETGLPARALELEITESNAMQNAESTIHILRELKALGVRISIDDFGIGYSSLSYLKRLPIDTLKIDQSFVRDITTDPDDAAIATAVIALAHTLKLRVVAEGVENQEQLDFLSARHCDRMQGFLFSHPLAAPECTKFLDRSRRG